MSFELYAYVKIPTHSTCPVAHTPTFEHALVRCAVHFVDSYPTRQAARRAAERIHRRTEPLWIDDILVPSRNIDYFEILEVS